MPKAMLVFALTWLLFLTRGVVFAERDTSRYPYRSALYSGNILASHLGRFRQHLPVLLQIGVDLEFSSSQRALITGAFRILTERSMDPGVLRCSLARNTHGGPGSLEALERQLYYALAPSYVQGIAVPTFLFVARFWNDAENVGIGYHSLFYDTDYPFSGYDHRHYFHIALNSDLLGPDSEYFLGDDPEYWAGVMAHEMLHNLGFQHSGGLEGSFIREYQNCLWKGESQGQTSEQLMSGDRVVFREESL